MRHRIKNQLNMLISYIDLNRDHEQGSYKPHLIQDLHNHINALSNLHNLLNRKEPDYSIPATEHLKQLLGNIVSGSSFFIAFEVQGDKFSSSGRIHGSPHDDHQRTCDQLHEICVHGCGVAENQTDLPGK